MIEELLEAVKDAETRAEKIVADANERANQIGADANAAIETIKAESENKILKINMDEQLSNATNPAANAVLPPVSPSRLEKAEKFIIDEFQKRFAK
jgi:vacuolar-type H+-ATPase subunit H